MARLGDVNWYDLPQVIRLAANLSQQQQDKTDPVVVVKSHQYVGYNIVFKSKANGREIKWEPKK
jgi:hypothetical protein